MHSNPSDGVVGWLLDGDPAIRWQTERDVLGMPASVYARDRRKVSEQGWGSRLLALQRKDASWGGGVYSPKWTSTTYTLLLLRDLGLDPRNRQAQQGCQHFLRGPLESDGGINLFRSIDFSETCVNGMLLKLLSYFRISDPRVRFVARFLLHEQMPDGGWNCEWRKGATHASFNTTIIVLEGLADYIALPGRKPRDLDRAVRRGREFLLNHHIYRSHRTGRTVDPEYRRMHFPPRWHYDIIRALDYFQSVRARRDPRMADAIELLQSRRMPGGVWPLNRPWPGRIHFQMEKPGKPSRWNTLRALRILKWWNA